jgi:hypothetical protein
MMDAEKAPLVIIKGPAGTAKTFYSLAIGLHSRHFAPLRHLHPEFTDGENWYLIDIKNFFNFGIYLKE